jgi:hypothetical protein
MASFEIPTSAPLVDEGRGVSLGWLQVFTRWHRVILSLQQSGPTAQRPTTMLWVGRRYFDTDLGKPVWVKTASPVAWVDAAAALYGSTVFDPPILAAGATQQKTVTVTGAVVGDYVTSVSHTQASADVVWFGQVTAADTVTVTQWNRGAGAVDLANGTLRVRVEKA